jgi:hypothetical protein
MYPQFGYGSLFGGGFGGFNPYGTFGAYDPYNMYGGMYGGMLGNYGGMLGNYGGLFGSASPYDDLFSSFQTKLDDLFKNYQTQLNTNAAAGTTPPADTTAPATTTPESKQVSWDKKTSKYGSQAEKQTAYDKIMNDPNASAEAKAMAEKGNVYKANKMNQPTLEQQQQTMINKISAENSAQPRSIDGFMGQASQPKISLKSPLTQGMNTPKATVDLSNQQMDPNMEAKLKAKQRSPGVALPRFKSQIGTLFGTR